MKRKALILLLFVCAVLPVCAQPKSWTGYFAGSEWPDASIIRTWNDNYVVSKYSYGGNRYLTLNIVYNFLGTSANDSVHPSAFTMAIPISLDILDFRIVNDSLVFCGEYAGEAAYGVVSPGLYNHVAPNSLDTFRIYHTPVASRLTRLVVSQGKMFAVGEYGSTAACVVEVEDVLGEASVMKYTYVGAGTGSVHEYLDDVVAVGDRIVFLGRDARYTGYHQLTLRSVNTQLGLLDPELGNDYHMQAPDKEVRPSVRGAATMSGMMGIAFSHTNLQTGIHSLQVHHVMPYPGVPTTQTAQGCSTGKESSVSEAVYIQPAHWLTVLDQYGGATSRFVTFDVLGAGGYASPMSYAPIDRYNSMDLLGTSAITSWGNRKLYLQKAAYPTTSCLPLNSLTIDYYPIFGWQNHAETISVHYTVPTPIFLDDNSYTDNLSRKCAN